MGNRVPISIWFSIVNHFTGFTDFFHFVLNVVGQGGTFDDSDSLVNHKVVDCGRFAAHFHLNLSVYGNHVAAFARAHQADVDAAQTVAVSPRLFENAKHRARTGGPSKTTDYCGTKRTNADARQR